METYKPLELVKKGHLLNFLENQSARIGFKPILIDDKEERVLEDFYEGKAFKDEKYKDLEPLFDRFNDLYKNNWLKACYNLTSLVITECVENLWTKNKQAVVIDDLFRKDMLMQKSLVIPYEMPLYLPFRTFVLDLQDQDDIKDTEYLICHLQKRTAGDGILLSIIRVIKDKVFTVYARQIDNVRVKDVDANELVDTDIYNANEKYIEWDLEEDLDKSLSSENGEITVCNNQENLYFLLALQVYLYMYIHTNIGKVDVEESEDTKETYTRGKTKIENTYDEVQKWNLGKGYSKRLAEGYNALVGEKGCGKKKPHYRCSHWSHYWIGTKKKGYKLEPRWIEGFYVGGIDQVKEVKVRKIAK